MRGSRKKGQAFTKVGPFQACTKGWRCAKHRSAISDPARIPAVLHADQYQKRIFHPEGAIYAEIRRKSELALKHHRASICEREEARTFLRTCRNSLPFRPKVHPAQR